MKHLSNLLLIVLLFVFFSLNGDVHGRSEVKKFHFLGKGMEIGKTENLQAKGRRPQKISRIQLAIGSFDPLFESEPSPLPQGMKIQALPPGEAGYYILQFKGPVRQDWKDAVMEAGAKILDYIPDFAFIVKMDGKTKLKVEAMDSIRWVGIYQPGYRIEPRLMQSHIMGEKVEIVTLIVVTFREEDVNSIADAIMTMGGTVLDVSETEWKGKIRVQIDSTRIAEISQIQGVKWVEKAPVWKLLNDISRAIMNVDTVWNPTNNLFGDGQVVAVADTGLDQGSTDPANLHNDFEDGAGGSRVIQIFDLMVPPDGANDVNSGHGTHVAGSVLGDGAHSGGSFAGVAPEAQLIFQAVEDNSNPGALDGIPGDLNTLFNQARTAGAHIHTNSWGAPTAGAYTSFSEEIDENAWANREFTILFAAGNEGIDSNADGIIDLYSMDSPATAKNCITVGASENDRPSGSTPAPGYNDTWGNFWPPYYPVGPIDSDHVSNNSEGMAAFSSRGPCLDGRTKPDVVAPGTNIISTLSSQVISPDLWGSGGLASVPPGGLKAYYVFSGGTSMSTPLAAGAAALVREFYTDQMVTPSSALIKATLINGAADMTGQYGGAEVIDGPRPNNVEGWGRLDLETSLFPPGLTVLEYYDETTGLTTGAAHIYNFNVGAKSVPLKVTLVWTDYPGSPVAGGGLVNDLDLTVTDPNGIFHFPNNAVQRGTTQIISYDDGDWNNGVNWEDAGSGWAVRFTPSSYPVTVDTVRFYLFLLFLPGSQITCNIWDDNGAGGLPGTNLFSQTVSPAVKGFNDFWGWWEGWYTVSISGVTINEGNFYVEMRYATTDLFNPFLAIDETAPAGRSYYYDGSSWSALPIEDIDGNWFIQTAAMAPAPATSADRVNNVVGIDIATPDTGSYFIRIEGYNIPQGPQPYALVVTGGDISSLQQVSPPQAPSDLSGQVISANRVDLTWTDNSGDETGFRIERKEGLAGTYGEIGTVGIDVTTYSDMTTIGDRIYYYRVRAFNASGDSAPSNESGVTTGIPDAPSDLSATAVSYSRIDLSWTDNSEGETGFKIERKTGTGAWGQIVEVGEDETSYADTTCAASTTYYYRVFSYNPLGDSGASNEASATTPAAPSIILPIGGVGGGGDSPCFIATAAYGSRMAKEVKVLERLRDEYLLTNELGRAFVSTYYKYGPGLAYCIAKHPMARRIVRIGLYPILKLSKWFVGGDPTQ